MKPLTHRLVILNLPPIIAVSILLAGIFLLGQTTVPGAVAVGMTAEPGFVLLPNNVGEGYPEDTVAYTHSLTNTGNSADTYTLTVSSSAHFPATVEPYTVTLAVGQATPVTVTVIIPAGTAAHLEDTTVAAATSSITSTTVVTATNITVVKQLAAVTIDPNSQSSAADTGDQVHYQHVIANTGNGVDTFSIEAESNQGYDVALSHTAITLAAGLSATITATVNIPDTAEGETVDVTTVLVISSHWPTATATATNTTTINTQYGVSIEPDNNGSVESGETIAYFHTLTNTGNKADSYTLTVVSSEGYQVSVWPDSIHNLANQATVAVTVAITVPADAAVGTIDTSIVTGTSSGDATIFDTAISVTTVTMSGDITFSPDNEGITYPGQTVVYTHTLTNLRKTPPPNTIALSAESSRNYALVITPPEVPLNPNQSVIITVEITIPPGAPIGQDVTVVTATPTHGTVRTTTNTTNIDHWKLFLPALAKPAEWHEAANGWPAGVVARSLAVCTSNSNLIVAGTINHGVWLRSGANWSKAPSVPDGFSVTNVVINSACNLVYVSLFDAGVWQGSRSGNAWTWVQIGGQVVKEARGLAMSNNIVYAGGEFGVRYWQNNAWQETNLSNLGGQPIMHMSAGSNSGPIYAVQWENSKIWRSTGSPATWEPMGLPDLPDNLTRVVYGTADGVYFVGTNTQSFELQEGALWQPNITAGLRAAAIRSDRSYLGFASGAGVYELRGSQLTPLTNGWVTLPTFVYDLRWVNGMLYAATTSGVWAYAAP